MTIYKLLNPRTLAVLFLGFASGLPLALCGATLQAWYTVSGVDLTTIGFLTLVGMPYVYKFLWAPLLDHFVPPLLDRRRGWIVLLQISLIAALLVMANANPQAHPWHMGLLALIVAFLSASQDTVINAYTTDVLKPEERGIGAAFTTYGYRVAMLVSGWGALTLAARYDWQISYRVMAACMGIGVLATYFAPRLQTPIDVPKKMSQAFIAPFKAFMKRPGYLWILCFIVLYKLGDAFTLSLSTTFLIRGLHFTLEQVGLINKLMAMLGSILGVLLGGIVLSRWTIMRGLWWFGWAQAITNLLFAAMAMVGHQFWFAGGCIFLENLCGGMGTAAFVAYLMSLCDKRFTATQFALLSALSAVGRTFVGPAAAALVNHYDWTIFYTLTFFFALPGMAMLWWLKVKAVP
ncbi:MAG: AmpG family muropeptide MFS transporter [marine bacterium B5-7]|nr:MAG: AmpG family muropeptide MFS transporter [marine bacterium B5-7]